MIREPQVAGTFYPSEPEQLKEQISTLLSLTRSQKKYKNIFGIVAPHAGYMYSGKSAAYAYNLLIKKSYKTVIIISPSHSEYFSGISIYPGDAYKTPLGVIEIDKEKSATLIRKSELISESIQGHRKEHALEVQLPFLQSVLSDFKIIPIVMGDQRKIFVDELALQISKIYDADTLVVASSDLSHFYESDYSDKIDSIVEENINRFDPDSLQKNLENQNCEACGGGPISVMLKAASYVKFQNSLVLNRCNSGDVTGDKSEVVGYLSAVVYND